MLSAEDSRPLPARGLATIGKSPRVLVLSCYQVGNFGDRLGYHLIHDVPYRRTRWYGTSGWTLTMDSGRWKLAMNPWIW